jgi:hypothetical protein
VPALKARYRRTPVRLDLHGAKADTWLAANLDNPFRDWVDDHARGGAAACKAYAAAVRAGDRTAAAQTVLRALIDALNDIDRRHELIDTLRREQAGDAFFALAGRAGVDVEPADMWFDEWREF